MPEPFSFDRSAAIQHDSATKQEEGEVPETWKSLHPPMAMPQGIKPYSPAMGVFLRSPEACADLKRKYQDVAGADVALSTNDVICGEVAEGLGVSSVGLMMEWRSALGADRFFGFAVTGFYVEAASPGELPGAIRAALPAARDEGFVRWQLGQGQGKIAPIMANSWVRAFGPLADIRFAGAAEDMMVSKAMCVGRAKFMAPMGMHYMIVLPLANGGVKVCLWASEEACSKFGDDVSVTNFE